MRTWWLQRSRAFLESDTLKGKVPGVLDDIYACIANNYDVISLCFEYYASRSMTNTMPISMDKKAYLDWIADAGVVDKVLPVLACEQFCRGGQDELGCRNYLVWLL